MPCEFNALSNLILIMILKDRYYYADFFLMGKLWLREIKCFSQGHTVSSKTGI